MQWNKLTPVSFCDEYCSASQKETMENFQENLFLIWSHMNKHHLD